MKDRTARGINPTRCQRQLTSGSTGEPGIVLRRPSEEIALQAYRLRAQFRSGLRLTDKRAHVSVVSRQLLAHRIGILPVTLVDGEGRSGADILRQLKETQPDILRAAPAMLEYLARAAMNETDTGIRPRLVFSGGDLLPASSRELIEQAFGCPVIDFYGAHEFNLIAWECRQCGLYHTVDDSVIVEVLKDGRRAGPGEEGQVVGTALYSFAMPFIRFELGDIARRPKDPPTCKVRFGTLERIEGRMVDFLSLPGGRKLSPYQVFHRLREIPGIAQFQVVQETPERVVVRYDQEVLPDHQPHIETAIKTACARIFPSGIQIHAEQAAFSGLSSNEKRRLVRSYER